MSLCCQGQRKGGSKENKEVKILRAKRNKKYQNHHIRAIQLALKLKLTHFSSIVVYWLIGLGQQVED